MKKICALLLTLTLLCVCFVQFCIPAGAKGTTPVETLLNYAKANASNPRKVVYENCNVTLATYAEEKDGTPTGIEYPVFLGDMTSEGGGVSRVMFGLTGNDAVVLTCSIVADGKTVNSYTAIVIPSDFKTSSALALQGVDGLNEATKNALAAMFTDTFIKTLNAVQKIMNEGKLNLSLSDIGFTAFESTVPFEPVADEEEDLGGILSGARWAFAGRMTLIGMGTVFAVLAILWGVISLFKVFMYDMPKKKAASEAPVEEPVAEIPVSSAEEPVAAPVTDDGALIAAITAAVAAMIASDPTLTETYAGGFRVVSFKRK